jgi:DNA-binding NarL/FixJ family response regulator
VPRILLIDDHPLYRHGFISALEARLPGYTVVGAASAEEGAAELDRHPDTDLVIIDFRLPEGDGLAALLAFGARHPGVPRVLMSGEEGADLGQRALAAGASGFIPKSMDVESVEAALRQVLAGDCFVPPISAHQADGLTLRQVEVLRLLGAGCSNRDIATALHITERTAKAHVSAIFALFAVENRTQAVLAAQRAGLL